MAHKRSRFVLGSGCTVAPGTRLEDIRALVDLKDNFTVKSR